jgi:hypothetical protein
LLHELRSSRVRFIYRLQQDHEENQSEGRPQE